jgi:thioester reductase-like protein
MLSAFALSFLQGASGFLGSQLLVELLDHYPIATIHCLVRRPSSVRIPAHVADANRVVEVIGNLSKGCLGLAAKDFMQLAKLIDIIVHAGAIVNHLVSYDDMYQTNVGATFEILKLALSGRIKAVHYISSTSAAKSACAREHGYSATKWAADQVFVRCRTAYRLPVSVYRPSLIIAHSQTGYANKKDWLHRLLQAWLDYRLVPEVGSACDQPLTMVSLDYCARVIVALMMRHQVPHDSTTSDCPYIYHIAFENVTFRTMLQMLLADGNPLQLHELPSHAEWFGQIEQRVLRDNHVLNPFLESFRHGLGGSSRSYDTTSLLTGIEQVLHQYSLSRESLEFSPLTRDQLLRTMHYLADSTH